MDWKEVAQEWEPILSRLRDEGFAVDLTSVAFPVQLEGRLPSGETFYFRERDGHCFLGVGSEDPVNAPEWSVERVVQAEIPLDFLAPARAEAVLRELLAERSS